MFGSGLVEGPAGFDLSILLVLKIFVCAGSGGNPKFCLKTNPKTVPCLLQWLPAPLK